MIVLGVILNVVLGGLWRRWVGLANSGPRAVKNVAGFFLMCGHSFIYMAYRLSPARVVAPFNYSFMIWAGLSGILVFGHVPNTLAIAGMALIMAAGLAVVFLEGRSRQAAPAVAEL